MAISVVGTAVSATSGNGFVPNVQATLPTVQNDDVAYFVVFANNSSPVPSMTTPSGWTLAQGPVNTTTSSSKTYLFSKTLTSADSGTTVTTAHSGGNSMKASGALIVLRGVVATPNVTGTPTVATATSTFNYPTVTPTVNNAFHVAFYGTSSGVNGDASPGTGWTQATEVNNFTNSSAGIHYREATGGANTSTGTETFSTAGNTAAAVFRLAFEPAVIVVDTTVDVATPKASLNVIPATVVVPDAFVNVATVSASVQSFDVTTATQAVVDLSTASVSAQANEPVVEVKFIKTVDVLPTADFGVASNGAQADTTSTTIAVNSTTNRYGIFRYTLPSDYQQDGLIQAQFGVAGIAGSGDTTEYAALITGLDTNNFYNSVVTGEQSFNMGFSRSFIDFTSSMDAATFDGFRVRTVGSGGWTVASSEHATADVRPVLRLTYEVLPIVAVDVDTPSASTAANDVVVEIVYPVHAEAIVMSAYASAQAYDASYEEVRTAVLVPTLDEYRAQGGTSWIGGDTLQVNYNPATNLSSVIVPVGTTAQKALVNAALERFDFPLEVLVSGIQAKYGRNYVEVSFGELGATESGGTILGQYLPDGSIILDPSVETAPASAVLHTLIHEIGHLVDDVYLTNAQRVSIWNALHTSSGDMLAPGTIVTDGVALDHGHYWLGGPVYLDSVGEAFANAFVRTYSDVVYNYNYFSHNATLAAADNIRAIVTPDMPAQLGPFPTLTPAARLHFGALPAAAVTGSIVGATLALNVTWNTGGQYTLRTLSPEGRTAVESAEKTVSLAMGANNVDVSDILDANHFGIIHIGNVKTASTQALTITSTEDTAANTEPKLTVRYVVDQGATLVDADTATATADAYEPAEVIGVVSPDAEAVVETATATASAPEALPVINIETQLDDTDTVMTGAYDVEVVINTNAWIDLDTPNATMQRIGLTDVNGEPIVPSESEDRYFNATMNTLIGVQRGFGGGLAGSGQPSAIAAERQVWFRMNEKTGTVANDRLFSLDAEGNKIDKYDLLLNNVTIGLQDGPEGRHHFFFNGDAYAEQYIGADAQGERESGIEFTFRTTKKNQFIMGNADSGGNLSVQPATTWELWMVDGRLEVRTWRYRSGYQTYELLPVETHRGFTDFADGQWHHVVLQSGYESWVNDAMRNLDSNDWGLELHVDSKLELRRRIPAMGVAGFPDYIGGRPGPFYGDVQYPVRALDIPRTSWYVGDMTEVVYRYGRVLSDDEIAKQRDTMFGIFPYYGEVARATAQADDAVVRGNKPRLLVLHMGQMGYEYVVKDREVKYTRAGTFAVGTQPDFTSDRLVYADDYDKVKTQDFSFVGWGEFDAPNIPSFSNGDFLWTVKNIFGSQNNKAARDYKYRDPITDNYRLIDLDTDLNMEDYDVITIVGYPTNEYMWNKFFMPIDELNAAPMIPVRKQLENLMGQVKQQVITNRKGLYLNDPFSAIALDLIDRVEFVPNFKEHVVLDTRLGAQVGFMDWHAHRTDPFYGANPEIPLPQRVDSEARAARYLDLHANVKQRVRAHIEGLTTWPGYIKTDHIVWNNVNPMNDPPYQESIRYEVKPAGLNVGDEFYMEGGYSQLSNFDIGLFYENTRNDGWLATPIRNIKVGTAVTTFANGWYATQRDNLGDVEEDQYIGNPYYDHAISIVVQPGDVWDGQQVSGKVYINFTESNTHTPEGWNTAKIQARRGTDDVDGGQGIGVGDQIRWSDGAFWTLRPEHVAYQFSTHFGAWGGSEIPLPDTGGSGADWGWSAGGTRGSGSGISAGGGEAISWSWESFVPLVDIEVPSMVNRAVKWLASDVDAAGNANVNVRSAKATVDVVETSVESTRNTFVELSTARVQAEAFNDMDTIDPDVRVLVGTASALARANAPVMEINLSTAVAIATAVEIEYEETPIDWSEALIMTLTRQVLTLILEDND